MKEQNSQLLALAEETFRREDNAIAIPVFTIPEQRSDIRNQLRNFIIALDLPWEEFAIPGAGVTETAFCLLSDHMDILLVSMDEMPQGLREYFREWIDMPHLGRVPAGIEIPDKYLPSLDRHLGLAIEDPEASGKTTYSVVNTTTREIAEIVLDHDNRQILRNRDTSGWKCWAILPEINGI